ncbi:YbgA family protein [Hathewaya massiliensis]|uniref:YbgA family protein n=1 Tax=Hathewaya massiliensis TaxID=1964382 RepID=UPI001FA9D180|nr:DUF523 and DUF1722 domain-containing protein [Hathewaya massiliensis]
MKGIRYNMKNTIKKPRVVVSRCLGFSACRYNGEMENFKFLESLNPFVEFITVCPEVDIGLPTPRNTIRLVQHKDSEEVLLIQPYTKKDLTKSMNEFSEEFLKNLQDVDGFILKSRSPSCGIKEVKIYNGIEKAMCIKKGKGVFGEAVIDNFPYLPIEDEGRLKNYNIRQHFLTKIFLMRDFREIEKEKSIEALIDFHSRNKLLLMSYNQKGLKNLGKILGNQKEHEVEETFNLYRETLGASLIRAPRYTSNINVLMKAMGYFKDKISSTEKSFILETIERYRNGKVPFSAPLYLIRSNAIRFNEENLLKQTFFQPYPIELEELTDSGKGAVK